MLIQRSAQFDQADIVRRCEQHVPGHRCRTHGAPAATRRPRSEFGIASVMTTSVKVFKIFPGASAGPSKLTQRLLSVRAAHCKGLRLAGRTTRTRWRLPTMRSEIA